MSEEKKLTDEEIVTAFEHGSQNHGYFTEINGKWVKYEDVFDLIHRLQDENNQLKSPKFASWKLKFFNLKEEFDKELAEHEEFTKKAKAEIERLKIDIKNEKNWGKIQTKQAVKDTAEKFAEKLKEKLEENSPIAGYDLEDLEFDGDTIQECINETYNEIIKGEKNER